MVSAYEKAVTELYQAPHESFVAERTRLASELKVDDKAAAARLAKLGRPSISAWAVNQLWWHSREAFDALFETAAKLRAGKLIASADHRKALAKLGAAAHKLLKDSGHGGADATLRRVAMTLSGLAAVGSFDPDPSGALSRDRDPPGFEAFGMANLDDNAEPAPKTEPHSKAKSPVKHAAAEAKGQHAAEAKGQHAAEAKRREAAAASARAAAAERQHAAEAHAKRQAHLRDLESALRDAKSELTEREHEHARLSRELAAAERDVERARTAFERAETRHSAAKDEV
jgi:hypothetical protein